MSSTQIGLLINAMHLSFFYWNYRHFFTQLRQESHWLIYKQGNYFASHSVVCARGLLSVLSEVCMVHG